MKKLEINYNCKYYENTGSYISSCNFYEECFASGKITCIDCEKFDVKDK